MKNVLRVDNLQRIDREDFEFAVDSSFVEFSRQLPANFLTDPNGNRGWVVSGFTPTNPSGLLVQVESGVAILSFRDRGEVKHGAFTTEGDDAKIVDLTGLSGVVNIYVRFEFVEGETQNRLFWDEVNDAEFAQAVPTRRVATWSLRAALATPGTEWLRIAQALVVGSSIVTFSDARPLYFEGPVNAFGASAFERTWGGGDDRNANRAVYGLKDLRTTIDALIKKVEELQSGTNSYEATHRWWEAPAHGSLDDMFPLDGSVDESTRVRGNFVPRVDDTVTVGTAALRLAEVHSAAASVGVLTPDPATTAGTRSVGASGNPFDLAYVTDAFATQIMELGEALTDTPANANLPRIGAKFRTDGGSTFMRTLMAEFQPLASIDAEPVRHFIGDDGQCSWTYNAAWNDSTARYTPDRTSRRSAIMSLDAVDNVFRVESRAAGAGTWVDNAAGWAAASLRMSLSSGNLDISGTLTTPGVVLEGGGGDNLPLSWDGDSLLLDPTDGSFPDLGDTTAYLNEIFARGITATGLPSDTFTFKGNQFVLNADGSSSPALVPSAANAWSVGTTTLPFGLLAANFGYFGAPGAGPVTPGSGDGVVGVYYDAEAAFKVVGTTAAQYLFDITGPTGTTTASLLRTDVSSSTTAAVSVQVNVGGTIRYLRLFAVP